MTTRNPSPNLYARYEHALSREAAQRRNWPAAAWHWFMAVTVDSATGEILTIRRAKILFFIVAALIVLTFVTGCTGGSGGSVDTMRQMIRGGQSAPTSQPTPPPTDQPAQIVPTETPDFHDAQPVMQAQPMPTAQPVYIEVTRQVVQLQPVEVTRIVEVTTTPQPAQIVAGMDESTQPCPVKYWHKGRCTATAAQLETYAQQQGGK